jgi:hypothetical protein
MKKFGKTTNFEDPSQAEKIPAKYDYLAVYNPLLDIRASDSLIEKA